MLITKVYNNDKPAFGGLILHQWKLFTEKCDLTLTAMVSDATHSRIGAYVLQSESSDKSIKTPIFEWNCNGFRPLCTNVIALQTETNEKQAELQVNRRK